ncbi:MAG: Z1 domain-containing protein [Campylobacterota bacterium]|nr:Z1 domain-containing protein [Campylobacterota bacterium]
MTEQTCRTRLITNIKDMIDEMTTEDENNFPTVEEINDEIVRDFNNMRSKFEFTLEQLSNLAQEIYNMEKNVSLSSGSGITSGYIPWVKYIENRQTTFASAYRTYLINDKDMPIHTVNTIFQETEAILDYLANPTVNEAVFKKGLVMGDVQSGKTANYLALINKAVDAGYKLIILISGVHNLLREQTQIRINEGFIGKDNTGVHNYREVSQPNSYTSVKYDFNDAAENFAEKAQFIKEPTILVIKKQKDVLNRLNDWLREADKDGAKEGTYKLDIPMLLIDDEADNASINTHKDPYEKTTINKGIRDILDMFTRKSYVGYTATPFANIFIDPDPVDKDNTEDLFPDNFIYSLSTSPDYIGATKLYIPHNEHIVKKIPDILRREKWDSEGKEYVKLKKDEKYTGCLAVGLKTGDTVTSIPESLKRAVDTWLLTIGIRKLEATSSKYNTLLVNVSHIKIIQSQVRVHINRYLEEILSTIETNSSKELYEIDAETANLKKLYESDMKDEVIGFDFMEILQAITEESRKKLIKTFLINSDSTSDEPSLNYEDYKETGLNAIAIGGYSLSRGFTLEGLTITYVLRESKGYDTLLQMGRWFGYRNGYAHLCRVYMGEEVIKWYTHIATASENLRSGISVLERKKLTPRDFCLSVLDYAGHLEITSANKRQQAIQIALPNSLSGHLINTSQFYNSKDIEESNFKNLVKFIENLQNIKSHSMSKHHYLWEDIEKSDVLEFLKDYQNPIDLTENLEIYLDNKNIDKFDVALISKDKDIDFNITSSVKIGMRERSADIGDKIVVINKGKGGITDLSHEQIGINVDMLSEKLLREANENRNEALNSDSLQKEDFETIEENFLADKTITRADCATTRKKPILFLHVLKIKDKLKYENMKNIVICSISMPGKVKLGKLTVQVNEVIYKKTK